MKISRIMIAAPKSGSGKTMITCALLQALKQRGEEVVSYKCGPDYIDPMFHQKIIGIPSKNLDTFFTSPEQTKALMLRDRTTETFAVLEGVMGLYDGLGGVREEGSSYHLAEVTKTPIILVVDAKGMGKSVIALIAGFLTFDTKHLIKGVILNRMSKTYYETLKPLIEEALSVCVLGYVPEHKNFHIESRHLGLVMPDEIQGIKQELLALSEAFQQTVSLDDVIRIAQQAEPLETTWNFDEIKPCMLSQSERPVIAVAKDDAFCFYYEDNINLLKACGADIIYFSPLFDRELPKVCDGILLGGGYPELYAEQLSANVTMRYSIKQAMEQQMPIVAECGGFMYLHKEIKDHDTNSHPMVGMIQAACYNAKKLVRFGYIEIQEQKENFLPHGTSIRGHEFHYFDSENNGYACTAVKSVTQKSYPCVIENENMWVGFPHLYYPSNPMFAVRFVEKARCFKQRKAGKGR